MQENLSSGIHNGGIRVFHSQLTFGMLTLA